MNTIAVRFQTWPLNPMCVASSKGINIKKYRNEKITVRHFHRFLQGLRYYKLSNITTKIKMLWHLRCHVTLTQSYLTDRHQCVSINKDLSALVKITHSIPQGSILGPLLFHDFYKRRPKSRQFNSICYWSRWYQFVLFWNECW